MIKNLMVTLFVDPSTSASRPPLEEALRLRTDDLVEQYARFVGVIVGRRDDTLLLSLWRVRPKPEAFECFDYRALVTASMAVC
jgi:hypothetical protein